MDRTKSTPAEQDSPLAAAWRQWISEPSDSDTRVQRLQLALDGDVPPSQLLVPSIGMEAA